MAVKITFGLLALAFVSLIVPISCSGSDVIALGPENFDEIVGGNLPVFVEFFAPWCGHCKALAPEYEILGTTFARAPVKIAALDADKYRDLATPHGIQGFPTIKFFDAGSKEGESYSGGRTAADMTDFINRKIGTNLKVKQAPSAVVTLDDSNFDAIVKDSSKDVLVEFYAPWCGHCKSLAPIYDKVGQSFIGENSVVIAKLDADSHREVAAQYNIQGYPTIKFFPRNNKDGEEYNGGRSAEDFVNFINSQSGTERSVGGGYMNTAGRIDELDQLAIRFLSAESNTEKEAILAEAEHLLTETFIQNHKNFDMAKFYTLTMKRQLKDNNYAINEAARLKRMLDGGRVNAASQAQFYKRININDLFHNSS